MPEPAGNPPAGNPPATPPTGDQGAGTQQTTTPPASWDEYVTTLPAEVKALYETHTTGLRTALQSERQQRGELAKQIKDLAAKAEKGSENERQLQTMSAQLEAANQRADFMAEATKPEIGCSNAHLAYIAAREAGAIDQKGRVNWEALKTAYPELFKPKVPAGAAGAGTQNPPQATTMNDFIRRAAGR